MDTAGPTKSQFTGNTAAKNTAAGVRPGLEHDVKPGRETFERPAVQELNPQRDPSTPPTSARRVAEPRPVASTPSGDKPEHRDVESDAPRPATEFLVTPKPKVSTKRAASIGSRLDLRLEAGVNELALGADEYAEALAHALDSADDEVCFALLGHWGRGKTFVARELAKRLMPSPDSSSPGLLSDFRASFSRFRRRVGSFFLARHPTSAGQKHAYAVVWLSAWRYPTTPQIWAHLYEELSKAALGDRWQFFRAVRSGFAPSLITRFALASGGIFAAL